MPEVRLGLIPSGGGLRRLPRLVGWGAAVDLILTGRRIIGMGPHELGIVQRLVESDELDRAVDDLLGELAATSLHAFRLAKEAMRVDDDERRLIDALAQTLCLESADAQERLDRFLARRDDRQPR